MIRAPAHRPPELRSRPTSAQRARMKTVWRRARRRAQRKDPRQRGNHALMSARSCGEAGAPDGVTPARPEGPELGVTPRLG
eukprot:4945856-Prymnesium_polylepis.1